MVFCGFNAMLLGRVSTRRFTSEPRGGYFVEVSVTDAVYMGLAPPLNCTLVFALQLRKIRRTSEG